MFLEMVPYCFYVADVFTECWKLDVTRNRSPLRFKQSDLTRALKAALACGLVVTRTEIGADGQIVLIHSVEARTPANELDAWRAKQNARAA